MGYNIVPLFLNNRPEQACARSIKLNDDTQPIALEHAGGQISPGKHHTACFLRLYPSLSVLGCRRSSCSLAFNCLFESTHFQPTTATMIRSPNCHFLLALSFLAQASVGFVRPSSIKIPTVLEGAQLFSVTERSAGARLSLDRTLWVETPALPRSDGGGLLRLRGGKLAHKKSSKRRKAGDEDDFMVLDGGGEHDSAGEALKEDRPKRKSKGKEKKSETDAMDEEDVDRKKSKGKKKGDAAKKKKKKKAKKKADPEPFLPWVHPSFSSLSNWPPASVPISSFLMHFSSAMEPR